MADDRRRMKPGARALGVAESYQGEVSTLAGAVVRASRVADGFAFRTCTVGGTDATGAICELIDTIDREDVRYVMIAGVALAWYNLIDLETIARHADRPVLAVTFESGETLEDGIWEAFDGSAREWRLERHRSLPDRHPVTVGDERVFVRSVGLEPDDAASVLRGFTPVGGRPEPLRVARLAARGADECRRRDF